MQPYADRIQPYDAEDANLFTDMRDILETLHRSGLSFAIACGGRGPIDVHLSDHSPNNVNELPLTIAAAALWLRDNACEHYPDSRFARKYRNQVERGGYIHTHGTEGAQSCGCTCRTTNRYRHAPPTWSILNAPLLASPEANAGAVGDVISSTSSKLAHSVPEFCEATSLGRSLVYEEIRQGRLRATKIGTRTIILREDGLAWLRSHR